MRLVFSQLADLMENSGLGKTSEYVQHGDTSCLLHTVAVAYYSAKAAEKLGIRCSKKELLRGALLHDYFLYDWHDGKKERALHGFTHPNAALQNAQREFKLSRRERDIIKKHMFPLTAIPPACREAWIVCCVDKACSVYETFTKGAYPALRRVLNDRNIRI